MMELTNLLMQNPVVLLVVAAVAIIPILKIVNKLLRLVSSVAFLAFIFTRLGGLELVTQFIK